MPIFSFKVRGAGTRVEGQTRPCSVCNSMVLTVVQAQQVFTSGNQLYLAASIAERYE